MYMYCYIGIRRDPSLYHDFNIIRLPSSSGFRVNAAVAEFSSILPEEVEEELKSAAEISMGTEISQEDCDNIVHLCDQVRVHTEGWVGALNFPLRPPT